MKWSGLKIRRHSKYPNWASTPELLGLDGLIRRDRELYRKEGHPVGPEKEVLATGRDTWKQETGRNHQSRDLSRESRKEKLGKPDLEKKWRIGLQGTRKQIGNDLVIYHHHHHFKIYMFDIQI